MLKWKRKTNIVFSARIETFSIRYSISHLNDFEFFGVKAHCLVHFQLQYSPFLSLPLSFFLPPMISHSATNLAYRYYFIRTNCASAKYFFPANRNIRTRKMKPSEYLSSMHSSKLSTMDYFSSITITWWHFNDKVSESKTHSLLFQPVENCAFLWFRFRSHCILEHNLAHIIPTWITKFSTIGKPFEQWCIMHESRNRRVTKLAFELRLC